MLQNKILKAFSETRKQRAKEILEKSKPQVIDEYTYLVPSQHSDKQYTVTHIDSYSCECEDYKQRCRGRGLYCKHIQAILLLEKLKTAVEVEETKLTQHFELTVERKQDNCPFCKSKQIFKRGKKKTKLEVKQMYCCKDCKKRFVLSPIKHLKGNAKMVCLAMDLYFKGNSLRDISDTFKQFYNIDLHHETIRRWIRKFTKVMNNYSKQLQPQTSGVWNADETLVLTKRGKDKKKQNVEFDYLWNVIDNKTKFLLASECSGRSRNTKDAQHVFKEAWKQNVKMPNQIITDKLKQYQSATLKTFRNYGAERKVKHTSIVGRRKQVNNNAVENLHTHQKEFMKVRRGMNEVQDYADGFRVFHNFVRKAVKDKKTPAERANIYTAGHGNRWFNLLIKSLEATNATSTEEIMISPSN